MQVSVLDLSLKCKTIASLVQVNVGMLKTLDLHAQSWKGFGCLAFPLEPAWKPFRAYPELSEAKACIEGPSGASGPRNSQKQSMDREGS